VLDALIVKVDQQVELPRLQIKELLPSEIQKNLSLGPALIPNLLMR